MIGERPRECAYCCCSSSRLWSCGSWSSSHEDPIRPATSRTRKRPAETGRDDTEERPEVTGQRKAGHHGYDAARRWQYVLLYRRRAAGHIPVYQRAAQSIRFNDES